LEREILLEFSDGDVSLSNWEKFCVIGDVASIYRPSVMFWTNSLVTPGTGLEIIRPWTIFGLGDLFAISKLLRTALQFKKKDQTANWTKDLIVILKMFKRTKKRKDQNY
jgi:hypothetical protein